MFSFHTNGIHEQVNEDSSVTACGSDENGNILLTGTKNGEVYPVNFPCIVSNDQQFKFKVHLNAVDKICFHKLNRFVVTKSSDSVIIWDVLKRSTEINSYENNTVIGRIEIEPSSPERGPGGLIAALKG